MKIFFYALLTVFLLLQADKGFAQTSANFSSGGHMIVGYSSTACAPAVEGSIRYNSAYGTYESCDGATWKSFVAPTSNNNATSTPATGTGYFILSAGAWDGVMGGIYGADALCLTDLTNNDWMGKTDAVNRGLLTAKKVRAFLCEDSGTYSCNHPLPSVTYAFGVSGTPATGGATFSAASDRTGPGDSANWSGATYFGASVNYWTHRGSGTATAWSVSGGTSNVSFNCTNFTSNLNAQVARRGTSNSTGTGRWTTADSTCDLTNRLICMVHP